MGSTVVILIRTVLGLLLGFAGVIVCGQGLYMIAHRDFPTWSLTGAMILGIAIGTALLYGAWRLLSTTLQVPIASK